MLILRVCLVAAAIAGLAVLLFRRR